MSDVHLYLSLIPQALIASMLDPEEFGAYYAVGTKVHVQGEALFFEIDPDFRSSEFPFELMETRCVPDADGRPKNSVYLSIYRVLSRIPIAALGHLYLVTNDGKTLELQREPYVAQPQGRLHLYQEFCPITPMVASRLEPHEFSDLITNPDNPVHVPRIVFSELELGELAENPESGAIGDLPYPNIEHIRDVLRELRTRTAKPSKLVLKQVKAGVLYRMVRAGFYVGDQHDFTFYRFPEHATLEDQHRSWWRSAQVAAFE